MSTDPDGPDLNPLSGEQFGANAVLDRMKNAWDVSTDSALADRLHTARQSISKWRSRNSVPYAEAVYTSYFRSVSFDWLLKGSGEQYMFKAKFSDAIDYEIIRASLVSIMGMGFLKVGTEDDPSKTAKELTICAKHIAKIYSRSVKTAALLEQDNHMTSAEAKRVAINAAELAASDGTLFGPRTTPGAVSRNQSEDGAQ